MNDLIIKDGNNDVKIITFKVGSELFGINISKVDSVIEMCEMTQIPKSHPSLMGVFDYRGTIISSISLRHVLGIASDQADTQLLVTNFNNTKLAFAISDSPNIISTIWKDIEDLPLTSKSANDDPIIMGLLNHDNRIISILDLETIVAKLNPDMGLVLNVELTQITKDIKVVYAEDNNLVSRAIGDMLSKSGLTKVTRFETGLQAYNYLKDNHDVDLLITDIEMPDKDGLSLAKDVKELSHYKNLDIIVFSSLINDDKIRSCKDLGISHWISKPELGRLALLINEVIASK